MSFKNVGTSNLGFIPSSEGSNKVFAMDAAGIASGQAFLTSELEKRDMLVRTPLTSLTYTRDIPIRVGGGWVDNVSAMQVGYGITGGSGDNLHAAGTSNGIPVIQANFDKGTFKAHSIAMAARVFWIDMQKGNMTGRNMDSLLKDGVRMAYDKHMEENTYVGFSRYGTTGLLNNPEALVTDAASNGQTSASTKFKDKTPDQILKDINDAILTAWAQAEYDSDAIPNHIIMPYEQFNYLATTKVSDLAEKTILKFLLDNNVAKANGGDLYIGATRWCKNAGEGGTDDRMVVYVNKEKYIAMDELVSLTRAMTSPNAAEFCYDTSYAGNVSEVEMFYSQTMVYVDGI